jgi:signal transduction histidine kinase
MSGRSLHGPRLAFFIASAVICLELVHLWFWFVLAPGKVPRAFYDPSGDIPGAFAIGLVVVVGALIVSRQPANRVGWILCATAVLITATFSLTVTYAALGLYVRPGSVPLPLWPLLISEVSFAPIICLPLVALPLLFPHGHPPSRRWLLVLIAPAPGWLLAVPMAGDSTAFTSQYHVPAPLAIGALTGYQNSPLAAIAPLFLLIGVLLAFVSLVVRYRRGSADERHQIKWFLAAMGLTILAFFIAGTRVPGLGIVAPAWLGPLSFITLPAAIGVAVLKYRLYDIDVVISRTLVYGSLAALITAVYVGIVVGVGTLIGSGGQPNLALSIVATAIVAVAFQPVRERLQKIANRLVYGKRATPYEVLSEFSERVAESYAANDVLPRMARVLAEGTGAVRADVWLRAGQLLRPAASWPEGPLAAEPALIGGDSVPGMPEADRVVEVRHQGELLGALSVTKRAGESLTPVEEKLLDDLASQAGLVLKNVGLTSELLARLEDLRASRQRLVAAQDEERRRLERNLHDGAQQNLVALKVKLGLAEMFLEKDPARAKQTLADLKVDTDEALETLRDLARGIYPPLLADKGLVAALESQARKATLPVQVDAEGVGRYPQEVEAAVYFCVLEALQNVQKYASASNAMVRLREEASGLGFEVEDDGDGFDPAGIQRGSGLTNMADRLEALGGSVDLASARGRGTRVTGHLPVRMALAAEAS